MRTRSRLLAALLAGALLLLTAAGASQAALSMAWMSVDTVMVNKLGGVSLVGRVDCSATAAAIHDGSYQVTQWDDEGNPVGETPLREVLQLQDGDRLILAANNDNYTVTQPAGRKTMIQASHGSSIMTPCYAEYLSQQDGRPIACEASGAPCTWRTTEYGNDYFTDAPPLYDYSPAGKFKTGSVDVRAQSLGMLVQVVRQDDQTGQWQYVTSFYEEEGTYAVFNGVLRAVAAR